MKLTLGHIVCLFFLGGEPKSHKVLQGKSGVGQHQNVQSSACPRLDDVQQPITQLLGQSTRIQRPTASQLQVNTPMSQRIPKIKTQQIIHAIPLRCAASKGLGWGFSSASPRPPPSHLPQRSSQRNVDPNHLGPQRLQ